MANNADMWVLEDDSESETSEYEVTRNEDAIDSNISVKTEQLDFPDAESKENDNDVGDGGGDVEGRTASR